MTVSPTDEGDGGQVRQRRPVALFQIIPAAIAGSMSCSRPGWSNHLQ